MERIRPEYSHDRVDVIDGFFLFLASPGIALLRHAALLVLLVELASASSRSRRGVTLYRH